MSPSLQQRLAAVQAQITRAAGPRASELRLVVVTKAAPPAIFAALARLGVEHLGENRVQGAAERLALAPPSLRRHFLGHLQSNKARTAVPLFDVFHGVDSIALLRRLDRLAAETGRSLELLLQVNVSGEVSKSGLTEEQLPAALQAAGELTAARVSGLMTMAPHGDDPEQTRPVFRQLARLRERHRPRHPWLTELSMGMSDDFEVALQEGATLLRIGRRLTAGWADDEPIPDSNNRVD